MGRMHSKGKGLSRSALPYKRSAPSWQKMTAAEVGVLLSDIKTMTSIDELYIRVYVHVVVCGIPKHFSVRGMWKLREGEREREREKVLSCLLSR